MFLNLVRPLANLSLDPEFVQVLMIFVPIANGGSRLIWGSLTEFYSFKLLYSILIMIGIISSSTIGFIAKTSWLYFIYSIMSANLLGAHFSLIPPLISKIYGIK
jgi:hypothetical protein